MQPALRRTVLNAKDFVKSRIPVHARRQSTAKASLGKKGLSQAFLGLQLQQASPLQGQLKQKCSLFSHQQARPAD
jgi:hypothetical protein